MKLTLKYIIIILCIASILFAIGLAIHTNYKNKQIAQHKNEIARIQLMREQLSRENKKEFLNTMEKYLALRSSSLSIHALDALVDGNRNGFLDTEETKTLIFKYYTYDEIKSLIRIPQSWGKSD